MGLNQGFWDGRRVLVTGHTGFKGAWLCLLLEHLNAEVTGVGLEPPQGGAYRSFLPWERVDSHIADLRDPEGTAAIVEAARPEVVIHMAAQALEPVGFADPILTYSTNVMSTVNLLAALANRPEVQSMVVVTSDKVYENTELGRPFREDDPLGGTGPYSGSKACVEYVVKAFRKDPTKALGPRIATARAGNVIGGGDHSQQRLLPDVFRALDAGRVVELRNPKAVRPWQFVLNPLYGYLLLAERLYSAPETAPVAVNFGPHVEDSVPVGQLVDMTLAEIGRGTWVDVGESFPEAVLLRLDSSVAEQALGWSPIVGIETAVRWTAEFHAAKAGGPDRRAVALGQITSYLERCSHD
ncbi:MAG TPA: CDP-glucose 4,6-dehydratase [Actinomycetota bacterium]|nr:CDP-glucose 4,6-dehydratase [Actinomycetota bacterium]